MELKKFEIVGESYVLADEAKAVIQTLEAQKLELSNELKALKSRLQLDDSNMPEEIKMFVALTMIKDMEDLIDNSVNAIVSSVHLGDQSGKVKTALNKEEIEGLTNARCAVVLSIVARAMCELMALRSADKAESLLLQFIPFVKAESDKAEALADTNAQPFVFGMANPS